MIPIVILASGRGSNFDAIYQSIQNGDLDARIAGVISDQPDAPILEKARKLGLSTRAVPFPKSDGNKTISDRRKEHEEILLDVLRPLAPKFLVLAGYKRILTSYLIDSFRCDKGYSRMINIHPSLLPSFPGLHSYAQAYEYGVQVAGVTVHLVEPEVDCGPICAQEAFSIEDCRSSEEVEARGLKIEHRLFSKTLKWVLPERFTLEKKAGGRFCVRPN